MSSTIHAATALKDRDVNAPIESSITSSDQNQEKKSVKSMEYHRQVLQSKMAEENKTYISPSDNIMSPCTAKINALRNKHASRAKPKSLFAQASAKRFTGESTSDNPFA